MDDIQEKLQSFADSMKPVLDLLAGEHGQTILRLIAEGKLESVGRQADAPESSQASTNVDIVMLTEPEHELLKIFPINTYTREVGWLLVQKPVQEFIRYAVMKQLYGNAPTHRPDPEIVTYRFCDFVFSKRFLAHCAKPTGQGRRRDHGRCKFPLIVYNILMANVANLGNAPLPGLRLHDEIVKDKCNTLVKNNIKASPYVLGSSSIEQMAHRLFHERVTFYENHKVKAVNSHA